MTLGDAAYISKKQNKKGFKLGQRNFRALNNSEPESSSRRILIPTLTETLHWKINGLSVNISNFNMHVQLLMQVTVE